MNLSFTTLINTTYNLFYKKKNDVQKEPKVVTTNTKIEYID